MVTHAGRHTACDTGQLQGESTQSLLKVCVQVCLHPALFYDMYHPATNDELISASGKLLLLHDILPKLQRAGHRFALHP